MPFITKQYKFCSAHRYWNTQWSEDKNRDIFGEDIKLHGHNYFLDVTVRGDIDPRTGMICDLPSLQNIIDDLIVEQLDHTFLNKDIALYRICAHSEYAFNRSVE